MAAEKAVVKGGITLGGLFIPVDIYTAKSSHDTAFHEYHKSDMQRSGRKTICKGCGKDIAQTDIVKGVEVNKKVLPFTEEEIDGLPISTNKTVEIDRFVDPGEIDPIIYEQSYQVRPEEVGIKAFDLFRRGLKKSNKVAIGKVAIARREHVCAVYAKGNGMMMSTMCFSDEVKPMVDVPTWQTSDDEMELISRVIDKYSKPFDHTAYKDRYNDAVKDLCEKKLKGEKTVTAAPAAAKPAQAINDALRAMLQ